MSETNGEKALLPDDVLSSLERHIVCVPLPECGGLWYGRELTLDQRDRCDEMAARGTMTGIRSYVIGVSWCNAEGENIEVTPAQIDALGRAGASSLTRCYSAVAAVSGIIDRDADIEEQVKNANGTPIGN